MKKLSILAAIICAIFMVSCGGVESKAKDYAKQIGKCKNTVEYKVLKKEIRTYKDTLSEEEREQFNSAHKTALLKLVGDKVEDFSKAIESAKTLQEFIEITNEISAFNSVMDKCHLDREFQKAMIERLPNIDNIAKTLGGDDFNVW